MKQINLKELSKMLSLNPSTVSRALSDHPDISPETKKRVKESALEFNYQPNLHARYFRKKSSGQVAVILPEFNMFFVPELMKGINSVIDASGLSIIIFFSNNSLDREIEIMNHCLSWKVDGVLISLSETTTNCDHLKILKTANIPVILMDKVLSTDDFPTVTINDKNVSEQATSYLLSQEVKKILGVFGSPSLQMTQSRLDGFITTKKMSNTETYHFYYTPADTSSLDNLKKLISDIGFDGIFVMSDEILFVVYSILRKLDLYPLKVKIVAISDGILPAQLFPPVPHIRHSGFEVGKTAAESLLKLKNNIENPRHIEVPTALVLSF